MPSYLHHELSVRVYQSIQLIKYHGTIFSHMDDFTWIRRLVHVLDLLKQWTLLWEVWQQGRNCINPTCYEHIFVLGSRAWFFGVSPWFDYPIQKSYIMILLPIFMEAWANSFGTNCGLGNIKQRVRLTTTLHPLNRNLENSLEIRLTICSSNNQTKSSLYAHLSK